MQRRIFKFIQQITKKVIPKDWEKAVICPILKTGYNQIPESHRPISLLSNEYKILAQLMTERARVESQEKIGDYQAGFRTGKSQILTRPLTELKEQR